MSPRRVMHRDTPPAPTTSTDLSVTGPPARVRESRPLPRWQARQIEADRQRVALLNVFDQMAERLGGILAIDQAAVAGDVLATMSQLIPPAGVIARNWKQAAAAVVVANHTGQDAILTMAGAGTSGTAPGVGTGVFRIPAGVVRVLNVRGTSATIYAEPGGFVDFVALIRPREPFAGVVCPGPLAGVAIAAGATTAQTVTLTGNRRSLVVVTNPTTASVGNTVQTSINGVTPQGFVYPILAGPVLNAVGPSALRVGPGLTPAANAVANDVVPRQVQIVTAIAGAVAYGVDYVAGE